MMSTVEAHLPAEMASVAESLATAALALARRFSAGATMWCVSPGWAAHGGHVAVEFVHPVIVGKRSLPSVQVGAADPAGVLRTSGRPGDVLLAVSAADDAVTQDLLRRAEAWGLTRLWLGAGRRPPGGQAEHIVWLDDRDPADAACSGDVVMLYHLLWELTHVVFEHPGLLTEPAGTDEVCITCSDQGEVAEVQALRPGDRAEVVARGQVREVDASLVGPLQPGDLILVHAGVAITGLGDAR